MHEIMLRVGRGKSRLFRQNVGMAWAGKPQRIERVRNVTLNAGDVVIRNARPFHSGIVGMSDVGGWASMTITPDMVGQKVAVYVAIEVKTASGVVRKEQQQFIDAVSRAGGIAGIARSVDEAAAIIANGRSEPMDGNP